MPSYSPDHVMGLPGLQWLSTREPNMYSSIRSGSVSAAHTRSAGAAISTRAVASCPVIGDLLGGLPPHNTQRAQSRNPCRSCATAGAVALPRAQSPYRGRTSATAASALEPDRLVQRLERLQWLDRPAHHGVGLLGRRLGTRPVLLPHRPVLVDLPAQGAGLPAQRVVGLAQAVVGAEVRGRGHVRLG